MGKIRLKIKSQPPPAKINFNLPLPTDNIKVNPPPLLPPPIGSLIPNLRVGCLPQAQKVLQMTLEMTLLNNQTVYIYIVQFIAIKFNSWVFHSL